MKADYINRIKDNFKINISDDEAYYRSKGYVYGLLDAGAIDVFEVGDLLALNKTLYSKYSEKIKEEVKLKNLNNKEIADIVERVLTYGNFHKIRDVSLNISLCEVSPTQIKELKSKLKDYLLKAYTENYNLMDGTPVERIVMLTYPREVTISLYGENKNKGEDKI